MAGYLQACSIDKYLDPHPSRQVLTDKFSGNTSTTTSTTGGGLFGNTNTTNTPGLIQ